MWLAEDTQKSKLFLLLLLTLVMCSDVDLVCHLRRQHIKRNGYICVYPCSFHIDHAYLYTLFEVVHETV
jgi:hypothetical protein